VRSYPGAAGTVMNNLVALGVGRVVPVTVIGDDGEGFELNEVRSLPLDGQAEDILVEISGRFDILDVGHNESKLKVVRHFFLPIAILKRPGVNNFP